MYSTNTGLPNVVVYSNKKNKNEIDINIKRPSLFKQYITKAQASSGSYVICYKTSKSIYVTMAWPPQVDV